MTFRVGSQHGHICIAQSTGDPDRSKFRINQVGAASRMRNLGDVNQGDQLALFGVDHCNLV